MVYRNWPQIQKVDFVPLLLALSSIDLRSDAGRRLISAFPECFSKEEVIPGPIPLSVLKAEGIRAVGMLREESWDAENLQSLGVLDAQRLPYVSFDVYGGYIAGNSGYPKRPNHIPADAKFADVVEHEGGSWIVLENNESCQEMHIVPLVCIDPAA